MFKHDERKKRLLRALLRVSVGTALVVSITAVSAHADFTGSQTLTFDDYGEGTPITNQYESKGIIFSGTSPDELPFIVWDEASFTNPVLSGTPEFHGTIHAEFVAPGTPMPTTVNGLAMDI